MIFYHGGAGPDDFLLFSPFLTFLEANVLALLLLFLINSATVLLVCLWMWNPRINPFYILKLAYVMLIFKWKGFALLGNRPILRFKARLCSLV